MHRVRNVCGCLSVGSDYSRITGKYLAPDTKEAVQIMLNNLFLVFKVLEIYQIRCRLNSRKISPTHSASEVKPIIIPQSAIFKGSTLNISPPTVTISH